MAKNIDFMGAIFPDVPSVKLPQQGGGLVAFDDTTDATATADKILEGYTAYAGGEKLVGTASGGITPSGTISITQNGTVDVTQYASADVNVSGGGGGMTLLKAESLGLINYTSTTAGSLDKSISVSGISYYDMLIVEISADNKKQNCHMGTVNFVLLSTNGDYYPDYEGHTNYATVSSNRINYMKDSSGNIGSKPNGYGVYPNSAIITTGTITMPLYARYSSNGTKSINDTYTARVYGVNLYDLL